MPDHAFSHTPHVARTQISNAAIAALKFLMQRVHAHAAHRVEPSLFGIRVLSLTLSLVEVVAVSVTLTVSCVRRVASRQWPVHTTATSERVFGVIGLVR
jgi:hypothetical protein